MLAAGQVKGGTVGQMLDMQQRQRLMHAVRHFGLAKPLIARAIGHILRHGVREQLLLRVLHHVAHIAAQLRQLPAICRLRPRAAAALDRGHRNAGHINTAGGRCG